MARVSFPCLCLTIPCALTSWCQVAKRTPPGRLPHARPTPLPTHRSHSRGPSPTVMSPSASASQLHPTQMQPPWVLGKGFWVLTPCPPSHMPASLHAAVFGWITALKILEVLQPGAPVLARRAVSPLGKGYLPQARSRDPIRGPPQDGLQAARMALRPYRLHSST